MIVEREGLRWEITLRLIAATTGGQSNEAPLRSKRRSVCAARRQRTHPSRSEASAFLSLKMNR